MKQDYRQHYKTESRAHPIWDIALGIVIGTGIAYLLASWWAL